MIIGIDTKTTRIACTVEDNGVPFMSVIEIPKSLNVAGKCYAAMEAARRLVEPWNKKQNLSVWVEEPIAGAGGVKTAIVLSRIQGCVLAGVLVAAPHATVNEVHVGTWKKAVVGGGNAKKQDVADWLQVNWPRAFQNAHDLSGTWLDDDLVDSAAICKYGMDVEGISRKMYPLKRRPAKKRLLTRK